MKKILSNIAAIVWFFAALLWMLLIMLLCLIMIPTDISSMLKSGFGTQTAGFLFLLFFSFIYGITMLVPAFRKCFKVLPWLYPYTVILTMDIIILAVAEEILNYGYSVQNDTRHTIFFVIMIVQMVVCRLAMCLYCHKKTVRIARDDYEQ